jgi:hypothetical protein
MNNENAVTELFLTSDGDEAVQITFVPGTGMTVVLGEVQDMGTKNQQFVPIRKSDEILFAEFPEHAQMYRPGVGWNIEQLRAFIYGMRPSSKTKRALDEVVEDDWRKHPETPEFIETAMAFKNELEALLGTSHVPNPVYGDCVMCGKENGKLRPNGDCYCGMCWTVWNS